MRIPRTLQQLKDHPWVEEVEKEEGNGYWLYLKEGYWSPEMETTSLHEFTITELIDKFTRVERGEP